jgi:preprotein translocase subunit SecA
MENFLTGQDLSARDKDNQKYLKSLQPRIDRINELEATIEELEDDELAAKTIEFRKRLHQGEDINGPILEEAFAVVREAAWYVMTAGYEYNFIHCSIFDVSICIFHIRRILELRHFDVQIMGGIILHEGRLAEMVTGEGKTLVATLPSYLNALRQGQSSFVITVNDYLAHRDMEKMGQVHRFLGLTVGLIQANMKPEQRREAYKCDVVYVTNSELGFDYLRDHLALAPDQTVLPSTTENSGSLNAFCLVDEADSVLIDEARTPLIISQQVPAPANKYVVATQLANALQKGLHYTVDLKNKNIVLTEVGYRDSENALGIRSLFQLQPDGSAWAPFVTNAVKARELFNKNVEYTILTNEKGEKTGVGIIDSFTGRVLDGRRWSDGLHQSIEAKEGINVSEQSKVIAKVTYQVSWFAIVLHFSVSVV